MSVSAQTASHRDHAAEYRADIDGLRAIAVLLVILHHYDVPGFRGGFVGVDVFFVISGFLIAGNIGADLQAGRFSLLTFYERRIRRIFPALLVMYALVLVAGTIVLFAPDLRFLSRIGAYVLPFLVNVALLRNAGTYGGQFADQVVLLHTWSLAVEEQFYLFFPILMLAIAALCRARYAIVLWPLALISFVACIVEVRVFPMAAFYLAPFRAWELLSGALLALGRSAPSRTAGTRTALALLGLVLIAAANALLGSDRPFPGEWTLLPCLGTVLILHAACDRRSAMGILLGNIVMRRIGLWSYSLYLVHWPLLVLARYYAFDPLGSATRGLMLVVTLLLGALSWRYVEMPFRGPDALLGRRNVFAVAAVSGIVLFGATEIVHRATDPRRYDDVNRVRFPSESGAQVICASSSLEATPRMPCLLGDRSKPDRTVVWGDSHAAALLPAINSTFTHHHEAVAYVNGGCPPLLGVYPRDRVPGQSLAVRSWMDATGIGRGVHCELLTTEILNWIIERQFATVILAGHWTAYSAASAPAELTDAESPDNDGVRNAEVFARGLGRLLVHLQRAHVQVFLVDDVAGYSFSVPYGLSSARRLGLDRDLRITRAEYDDQQRIPTQLFKQFQQQYGARVLKPQDILCNDDRCMIARNEVPLYRDEEHLAIMGAMTVEPIFEDIFAE